MGKTKVRVTSNPGKKGKLLQKYKLKPYIGSEAERRKVKIDSLASKVDSLQRENDSLKRVYKLKIEWKEK